jgi:ABC-type transport system involved in multi-copper enzyme maturation permease subunit
MSATALASSRQQSQTFQRVQPLGSVLLWELRRFRASRLFWLQALAFFGLALFVIWTGRTTSCFGIVHGDLTAINAACVVGTSPWGLFHILPMGVLVLLVILLPFVNADGVTRDLHRRTHELLMTTALPNWAYIWGRYLLGLLVSLGLAVVLLFAVLGMGVLLHLTTPAYPLPQGDTMLIWLGVVVPATVLVSSLSFALGTIFPRQSNLVKIAILVAWISAAEILPIVAQTTTGGRPILPAWYENWDPTSAATAIGMFSQYQAIYDNVRDTITSSAQLQNILIAIENMMPNVSAWFIPHLILAGLSLLLVVVAMFAFQRFRRTFGI